MPRRRELILAAVPLAWLVGVILAAASDPSSGPPVVVHSAPAPAAGESLEIEDFPIGVTILGHAAPPARGGVVVSLESPRPPARRVAAIDLPEPPVADDQLPPVVSRRPVQFSRLFQNLLARAERESALARTELVTERGGWQPVSSFPDSDPETPYPWQPVTWGGSRGFGWSPTSAWSSGGASALGGPVRWSRPIFDTRWEPDGAGWGKPAILADPAATPPDGSAVRNPSPASAAPAASPPPVQPER